MKNIFLILFVITCISCSEKRLVLLKSTSQTWSNSDKSSNGTNFHFLLKTFNDKTDLIFDSLCINNKLIKNFHFSVLGKSNTYTDYIPGDTIIISINTLINTNEKANNCFCNKDISSCIYYSFKKKSFKINVNSMISLPNL